MALTDTLDDLISEERINPQLAMKILVNFDQAITEALQKSVRARMSFKVDDDVHSLVLHVSCFAMQTCLKSFESLSLSPSYNAEQFTDSLVGVVFSSY
jgi:transcription initiation factor TFIIA small subunit